MPVSGHFNQSDFVSLTVRIPNTVPATRWAMGWWGGAMTGACCCCCMVSFVVLLTVMPSAGGLDAPAESNATTATGVDVPPVLQDIRIGLLTTAKPEGDAVSRSGLVVSGAVLLAIHTVNDRKDLLPNHRLVLSDHYNTGGNELGSIRLLTNQWAEGVVAFFGPDQTCSTEARIATAWNLPMISYVSVIYSFLFHS